MARTVLIGSAAWLLACAAVVACGSRLKVPEYGAHTSLDQPIEVPSPPPEPVQVEDIYASPDPRAVWIDGSWTWRGRRWEWSAGSWQIPPAQAYYSRPALIPLPVAVYDEPEGGAVGRMRGYAMRWMYIPGHWHLRSGGIVQAMPASSACGSPGCGQ